MPDLSLSTGVSLGLLAGIVSGVCYLIANRVTWPKEDQSSGRRCLRASKDDGVCVRCGGEKQGGYIPCICRGHKPVKFEQGAWFLRQVQQAASLMPWSLSTDKLEQIDEECNGRDSPGPSRRDEQDQATVREFLETLAAKLAGGPLEGTRVDPLYDHPSYLPPLRNGSQSSASSRPSSGASNAHVHLKRLVARVVEEAAALPALARYAADPQTPTIETSTYEDLLASAILNKVVERFQNESGSGGRSSGIHSASASPTPSERSSPRSHISRTTRDITPPLHEEEDVSDWEEGEATEEALGVPRRVPFPEFGGDIVHQADDEEREFDEVSNSDIQGIDGSWEENWLFQKKKIKTIQSVPVPMLVPNSNTDYRALIGDRDADDTTDLSDNASDTEEQAEYKSDIKKVLDSKHVIGGKIKVDDDSDYEPDSLTMDENTDFDKLVENGYKNDVAVDAIINEINDNVTTNRTTNSADVVDGLTNGNDSVLHVGIDEGPLPKAEFNLKEEIHRTLLNGNATHYLQDQEHEDEVFDDSIESNTNNKESSNNTMNHHEREGEYEETVTIPVQRYADSLRRKHFEDSHIELRAGNEDPHVEDELVPGSVADRERKKWLNAVDMPNNPYSPEAIQKRLLAKSTSSIFDMITKNQCLEEEYETPNEKVNGYEKNDNEFNKEAKTSLASLSTDRITTDRRSKSPSPKILKDVLAEEVPQYKRYGRDYYIREAKASTGGRKKNSFSDTSSLSSMNKSPSLDNFDTELATPVSASSSLSDLEACALHQNISRAVLSPRHASPNFAINPIFEQPDRQNDTADEYHAKERYVDGKPNVREQSRTVCNGGDGYVENEDIVRLKIPNKPEITEDLFETYTNVRRNHTLRSEDLYARAKRRPGLNFTFGGSLSNFCNSKYFKTLVELLIKQFNVIATNQQYTKFIGKNQLQSITTTPNNKTDIIIEYEDHNNQTLYSARPVIVDDDTDEKFEEILQSAYTSEIAVNETEALKNEEPIKSPVSDTNSYVSSSSLEDSIKIYNVQTGEVIKCRPEDNISARYETAADSNENIDINDKTIPGDIFDSISQNVDLDEEAVIIHEKENSDISELEDILPQLPKVKELAKKFVSMENLNEPVKVPQPFSKRRRSKENVLNDFNADRQANKQVFMHSLTARSISKEFREELKLSMSTPLKVPGGSKEIPDGEEVTKESSRPGSPVPQPGTIKTKLAFFESLKTKFNSK